MVLFHQMLISGCLASTGTNMVETALCYQTVDVTAMLHATNFSRTVD